MGLFLVLLAGCGLTPAPPILKETPSVALGLAQEEALSSQRFINDDWPEEEWWRHFEDPQLDALVLQALQNNPNITMARARLEEAMAISDKSHAPMFPTLDFEADITRIHQSENGIFGILRASDPTYPITYLQRNMGVTLAYEFDFYKAHRNEMLAAMNELQALEAEEYLTRLSIAISVSQAYFQYNISRAREKLAEKFLGNRREIIVLMQEKHRRGLESELTVNRTSSSALSAEQFFDETSQDVMINGYELQALLGGDFTIPIEESPISDRVKPFPLPCSLPMDLLAHRPDVWARRWRVEAAARKICIARAAFYPNIDLSAVTGFQAIRDLPLLAFGSTYGLIYGPSLHLPIFKGGALQADLDASHARYRAIVADYDNTVITAAKEVLEALAVLEKVDLNYATARSAEHIAQRNLELVLLRRQRTLSSKIDFLAIENELLQAMDTRLQAFFACLQARLVLIRALGGGYEEAYVCVD